MNKPTHPQEPSAERVEAGAKALVARRGLDWTESLTDKTREHYREDASAVLIAADAATPQAADGGATNE